MQTPRNRQRTIRRPGLAGKDASVVLVIVALILIMGLPMLSRLRMQSRRGHCDQQMTLMVRALRDYEQLQGQFPGYRVLQARDRQGIRQPTSWVFRTLLFWGGPESAELESNADPLLGRHADLAAKHGPKGPDATRGTRPRQLIPGFACPSLRATDFADDDPILSYVLNSGMPDAEPTVTTPSDWPANGIGQDRFQDDPFLASLDPVSFAYIQQHDGADATVLLSENVDAGKWIDHNEAQVGFLWQPELTPATILGINQEIGKGDGTTKFARPSSYHPGGVYVAYVSGRVEFLNDSIDPLAYLHLLSPDGTAIKRPGTTELVPPPIRRVVVVDDQDAR